MHITAYDDTDDLLAYLIASLARRQGHIARQVTNLDEISGMSVLPPSVLVIGAERVTGDLIDRISSLRSNHEELLIYLLLEAPITHSTIAALEAGATDVLQKPVLPREVLLRAERAIQLRGRSATPTGALRVGDIEVDLDRIQAVKAGRDLTLTRMELRLLYCLLEHHGRVTPTERLLSFGWETDEPPSSTLKTHISHLRQKLREAGGLRVQIKARQMLGYVMEVDGASASRSTPRLLASAVR